MHRVTLNYLKLSGPLLGVGTDAAKISCGGSKLDADEREATAALRGMLTKWTQWETSSGDDDAIRAKRKAEGENTVALSHLVDGVRYPPASSSLSSASRRTLRSKQRRPTLARLTPMRSP